MLMLTPIYLTFATDAEALAALYNGDAPRYSALEILNPCPMPVCTTTGEVYADGSPVLAAVPGYHVNAVCRGACPEALEAWRVYPKTPFAVLT